MPCWVIMKVSKWFEVLRQLHFFFCLCLKCRLLCLYPLSVCPCKTLCEQQGGWMNERGLVLSAELCFTLQKANNLFTCLPVCEIGLLTLGHNLQLLSLTTYFLLSLWDGAVPQRITPILQLVWAKREALLWGAGDRIQSEVKWGLSLNQPSYKTSSFGSEAGKAAQAEYAVTAWKLSYLKTGGIYIPAIFILVKIPLLSSKSFPQAYILSVPFLPDMFALSNHCSMLNGCCCSEWRGARKGMVKLFMSCSGLIKATETNIQVHILFNGLWIRLGVTHVVPFAGHRFSVWLVTVLGVILNRQMCTLSL